MPMSKLLFSYEFSSRCLSAILLSNTFTNGWLCCLILQWWWIGQVAYVPTSIAVKTSIAGTLLRLAFRRIHHIILWTVIGVTVAFNSAFCFVLVLQCRPVSYFWNRLEKGTCIDFNSLLVVAYVYSISAALCDFAMGILPIALVRKLNMNARAKWALAGILSLGCVYVQFLFPFSLLPLLSWPFSLILHRNEKM